MVCVCSDCDVVDDGMVLEPAKGGGSSAGEQGREGAGRGATGIARRAWRSYIGHLDMSSFEAEERM